jgi:hypothetical protein
MSDRFINDIKRNCIFQEIQSAGDRIMLNPKSTLEFDVFYNEIVGGNTLRAFHRKEKNSVGPTEIVREFIIHSKVQIIKGLEKAKSTDDIDLLSDEFFRELKARLEVNVQDRVLKNYNAVRKLVDLILEHVALIATELNENRKQIIPYLRVPLDSFILNSDCLFKYQEREDFSLKANGGGFLSVRDKDQYHRIQNHLIKVSQSCKISNPIYFDVLWRDRINYQFNILNKKS